MATLDMNEKDILNNALEIVTSMEVYCHQKDTKKKTFFSRN